MGRIRQSFCMMSNVFREERRDKRVIMGFILGVALFGYWMIFFLRYVQEMGEPVNVLETFIVIGHHYKNMLFLVLGWLLVIADAPFIKGNIYFILYRSSRKSWNLGMLFYIMMQAFLFTACIALVSVAVSSIWGFWGAMWSSPVYHLAMDRTNQLGVKYNITFPWENMMQSMAAPEAFALTFLFLWLYFVFLGVLLYVCNLFLKEIFGALIVFGVQLSGYLMQQDGYGGVSLMARAMPGYSIDGAGGEWKSALLFVGLITFLALDSLWLAGRVDFKDVAEGQ